MVEFLSEEWFEAVTAVEVGTDAGLTFRLDQTINGAPSGDVQYRITLSGGRLRAERDGSGGAPDASLRLAYRTATDLASGRRTAHDALLAGEVTFDGDPGRIQELAAALGVISSALSTLRDRTTYP